MKNNRENALLWWRHDLSQTEKENLIEGKFKHRHPQSLTGSEIESLWKSSAKNK